MGPKFGHTSYVPGRLYSMAPTASRSIRRTSTSAQRVDLTLVVLVTKNNNPAGRREAQHRPRGRALSRVPWVCTALHVTHASTKWLFRKCHCHWDWSASPSRRSWNEVAGADDPGAVGGVSRRRHDQQRLHVCPTPVSSLPSRALCADGPCGQSHIKPASFHGGGEATRKGRLGMGRASAHQKDSWHRPSWFAKQSPRLSHFILMATRGGVSIPRLPRANSSRGPSKAGPEPGTKPQRHTSQHLRAGDPRDSHPPRLGAAPTSLAETTLGGACGVRVRVPALTELPATQTLTSTGREPSRAPNPPRRRPPGAQSINIAAPNP